jgi:hypothetical protein
MNISSPLTLTDPLAGQPVTIVITLPPADGPAAERPALLSLGGSGQTPVFRQGPLTDLPALIDEAWTAYGLQRELAAVTVEEEPAPEPAAVTAAATTALAGRPTPPPPQPHNLSLF